jgi:hypothetical protein
MPPSRLPPDDPREWLNRARSSLAQAGIEQSEVYLEDLCFQAQQAAEKALKALLLHKGARFPHVHDLAELVGLLEKGGTCIPPVIRESVKLTDYAVEAPTMSTGRLSPSPARSSGGSRKSWINEVARLAGAPATPFCLRA